MTFPSDLPTIVNDLAVAKKQLAYFLEKLEKMQETEQRIKVLESRLAKILHDSGMPEEAAELLLAAR